VATGLLETPALGPCQVTLRPYQEEAIDAVRSEFLAGRRRTLLVMATGLGKTITFGMIARRCIEKHGRVLVLAHRKELIEQAVNKLDLLGVEAGVEMGKHRARATFDPDAVVGTVQTLQGSRLASWPEDYFRMVVVDEAHHGVAATYEAVLRRFRRARVLGVTATVDRADEEDLGQVFESVAYDYDLFRAMTAPPPGPYLCRLLFVQCGLKVDLRDLRPRRDDYSEADLEERIAPLADVLAVALRNEFGERRTIVFTPGVKSAQGIATALQSLGVRAEWSSGSDPDRDGKVERFRRGESQVFVNCQLATEGFDVPEVSAIGLCRPTRSRLLYSQQVGRGTRLSPGKADCLLIDFDYLTARHDLVRPVELFDSTGTDSELLDLAAAAVAKAGEKPKDLLDALAEGRDAHRRLQADRVRERELKVKARDRELSYRRVTYDPLAVYDSLGLPWRGKKTGDAVVDRATPGQVEYLSRLGVTDAPCLSRTRASTLLDYLAARKKQGLATLRQVSWAIAKGCDPVVARAMRFDEASAFLDKHFRRGA
jgi:superfamily II DNA or RNA helicase